MCCFSDAHNVWRTLPEVKRMREARTESFLQAIRACGQVEVGLKAVKCFYNPLNIHLMKMTIQLI